MSTAWTIGRPWHDRYVNFASGRAEQPGNFAWPGGAEVAVSLSFDLDAEAGWIGTGRPYGRRLSALSEGRYGVVRGTPRLLDLLARHEIRATFFIPGYTAQLYPDTVRAVVAAGHEVAHHGHLHLRSDQIGAKEQRAEIEEGLAALAEAGAPRPVGYRSASWELTPETFDLLLEHGFGYDSSCMGDDRPYWEQWGGRRILELPVHWSLDDWPRFGWSLDGGGNATDPVELYTSWLDEYELARAERRSITYTMHPEVIGRGQRFVQLARLLDGIRAGGGAWFAPLVEVAEHVRPGLETP
jgi:peptidoglycan/xylan/chitin deacetylase (PgdA/CDA1 family)